MGNSHTSTAVSVLTLFKVSLACDTELLTHIQSISSHWLLTLHLCGLFSLSLCNINPLRLPYVLLLLVQILKVGSLQGPVLSSPNTRPR